MEYEKIKQLMEDMGNSKLTSIDIDFPDGTKISMKKEAKQIVVENLPVKAEIPNLPVEVREQTMAIKEQPKESKELQEIKKAGFVVKSPMVGTFYSKPSPDSDAYVSVGQHVKKGDVLCIVEAMKLMNEIESEFDGVVKEVLVSDGDAVEYGKPLFIIE